MKAGFAKACVNPPLGMPMEGLGQAGGIESIHDDLFVRALWLEQDRRQVLIVAYDLLFFERPMVDRLKGALGRSLDLAPRQILINFSHTHNGPYTGMWQFGEHLPPDYGYLRMLEERVLTAIEEAAARACAVGLRAGVAHTTLPVNRRRIDAAGHAQWAPSLDGPVYDRVPLCLLSDEADLPVALLFCVACHATP